MTEFIEKATGQVVTAERFLPEREPWPDGIITYDYDTTKGDLVMGAYGLPISDKWVALLGRGDWIVTRPDGYRTVCWQDVFPDSYEPRAGEYVRLVERHMADDGDGSADRGLDDLDDVFFRDVPVTPVSRRGRL
jgi:hypothetical protein